MTIPAFWDPSWLRALPAALVNHLWQSTLVFAIAWLLALALSKNRARTRYWVWMAASVKFLVPFALLMEAGQGLRSLFAAPPAAQPALAAAMQQIAQPFPQTEFFAAAAPAPAQHANLLPVLLLAVWACGAAVVLVRWTRGWLRMSATVRAASPIALASRLPALSTPALLEPGVFGIFRPVLLLPAGILDRLTPAQFEAIVAHEMCHVRRRDNLTYAAHMIVEALFWFYPPVWWIGARLIEERERACDEAVVEACGQAEVYAEGILNVCKHYVESPLACVSGVSGSDLKKRIVWIMTMQGARRLSLNKRLLLAATPLAVIAIPLSFGLVNSPQNVPQMATAYEVVSIKPHKSGDGNITWGITPDGLLTSGVPLQFLIMQAYDLITPDQISGLPGWAKTDSYDIAAKMDEETATAYQKLPRDELWSQQDLMIRSMLADRFQLKVHHEVRELPVYDLVIAKDGLKMKQAPANALGRWSSGERAVCG